MRSPNRVHDCRSFFKYMSASTADIVLANRTLRWSSPTRFNDPFDVPRELSFGVVPKDIVQALVRRVAVTYPSQKPTVYTAEGWAELFTMTIELSIAKMLDVATYTKAPDWSYENEWRITSFKRPNDTGDFTDYKLHPQELSGVYLGPMIGNDDRNRIATLAAHYPAAKVWNVAIGMSLEFEISEVEAY